MNHSLRLLPLLLLAAFAPTAQAVESPSPPTHENTVNHFIVSLLRNAAQANDGNICLCPYSVAATITLLEPGAAPQTRRELQNTLGDLSPLTEAGKAASLYIESTHRIYLNSTRSLNRAYTAQIPDNSAVVIDFRSNPEQARTTINQWAESATHGLIGTLLAPGQISSKTTLTAVNAVYIKDRWDNEFDDEYTTNEPFTLNDGSIKQVPTMHLQVDVPCTINNEYSAIALPFVPKPIKGTHNLISGGGMIFILPLEGTTIDTFIQTLTPNKLDTIRRELSYTPTSRPIKTALLSLPKFQTSSETNLIPILQNMGLHAAFSPDHGFPHITTAKQPLPLDSFLQKCTIRIDEEGTEGAASTAMVALMEIQDGESDQPIPFRLNRPFIWFIVPSIDLTPSTPDDIPEKHNHPVFMGIVKEPHFPSTSIQKRKHRHTAFTEQDSRELPGPPRAKRPKFIVVPMKTIDMEDLDIPWADSLEFGTTSPPPRIQ